MKNTFGTSVCITLFGESHGPETGIILDGLAPGMRVDEERIRRQLTLRRPQSGISTSRREPDEFRIVSGVRQGRTTGTPLCLEIPNVNVNSSDYDAFANLARPGHADYTAMCKYHGFQDSRGGGHFSGRLTAALVAGAAVVLPALEEKNIRIGTHLLRCAGIPDRTFENTQEDIAALNEKLFAVLDPSAEKRMKEAIERASADRDSVGGILETAVTGVPAGIGEPWFDTLEGMLAHALFSIPAVKGVEFGSGFGGVDERGSAFNDPFRMEDGQVRTRTNHNGGINGGISNGMPLVFRCAVKPTPTIGLEQETVDMVKRTDARIEGKGRHDPCILPRARVAADSMTALVLCDLLAQRYGTDWLGGEKN